MPDFRTAQDKLRANVVIDENGCWLWERAIFGSGYPWLRWDGKAWAGHRLSWVAFRGPIPAGKLVCHQCDVKRCVNPDHLWLGSHSDNTRDCIRKGRFTTSTGLPVPAEFHCSRGHLVAGTNASYYGSHTSPRCRTCVNRAQSVRQKVRRATDPEFKAKTREANRASYRRRRELHVGGA